MSDLPDRPEPTSGQGRGRWALILVLLGPAVILPLWVSLYDREEPTLGGWPFFFWFQMALIVVAVGLTLAAYRLAQAADRDSRVRHGLTPEPPADDAGVDGEAGR